jgi:ABC-type transport system substrate-binding protein
VQVDLRNYATADYLGTWASGGVVARGQYEVGLWDWTLTPDPQSAASYLASDRIPPGAGPAPGFNYGRFQDPEIDSALSAGAATLDGPARAAAYRRLMQSYYAFGGEIPLAQRVIADVATPRLHNLRPNPDVWSTDAWNCADWWVG